MTENEEVLSAIKDYKEMKKKVTDTVLSRIGRISIFFDHVDVGYEDKKLVFYEKFEKKFRLVKDLWFIIYFDSGEDLLLKHNKSMDFTIDCIEKMLPYSILKLEFIKDDTLKLVEYVNINKREPRNSYSNDDADKYDYVQIKLLTEIDVTYKNNDIETEVFLLSRSTTSEDSE